MSAMEYVLITPAKNEEQFIEKTLQSVVAQTVLPQRWVIVSDGSTDRTDEIVSDYAERYPFIKLLRRESSEHSFRSMVQSALAALDDVRDVPYEFFGNLDADIELPPDYYERLLERFAEDDKLGLTGGTRSVDLVKGEFVKVRFTEHSIGGAYQVFRRACYEEIGGFIPLELGGVDTVAEVMARHHGWRVRAFEDIEVLHYRPTGTAEGNLLRLGYRAGKKRFLMGYHPLFECAKLMRVRHLRDVLHNLSEFAGYSASALRGLDRQVPDAVVEYLQAEQLGRLNQMVFRFRDPSLSE